MNTLLLNGSTSLNAALQHCRSILPGLMLCLVVTAAAYSLETGEAALLGKAWLEALVLAILIGTAIRSVWSPTARWRSGISFSAKYLLEIAVVLLGASVSAATILASGSALLVGIVMVVVTAIVLSYSIGRTLGLSTRMALLVACGNSICGNSAIAAVAPVIGADCDDVAASIAFTAVLGVIVVLLLPLVGVAFDMQSISYGALAGLTVYAVPQVIAAASPFGATAIQMATLVKLVRVLMLGPVCFVLSLIAPRLQPQAGPANAILAGGTARAKPGLSNLVPWFIVGFLALLTCRSLGLLPTIALVPISQVATFLTVVSMAALGLGVDIRTVARAGGRVTTAVVLSLVALGAISFVLIESLRLA